MLRDARYGVVLDASGCPSSCAACEAVESYWLEDSLDAPDLVLRVPDEHGLAAAVLEVSARSGNVLVQQCVARVCDIQARALLQTLQAASPGILAVAPLLGVNAEVALPLPRPTGGWVTLSRAARSQLGAVPSMELSACPVLVLNGDPLWASGALDALPASPRFDDLLAGMRIRGYRLHVDESTVVETDVAEVNEGTGSFPSDPEVIAERRAQRLGDTLQRVQSGWRAEHIADRDEGVRVLVDARGVKDFYNGTQQLAMALLDEYLPLNRRAHVLVSPEAMDFHGLQRRWGGQVVLAPDWVGRYDHAFRIDQPWSWADLALLGAAAPTISTYFLDVIAWDTAPASRELGDVWAAIATEAEGLLFLSEASRKRFTDAFPLRPRMLQSILYPSLDPEEYLVASATGARDIDVLVVGNGYPHKDLDWAVEFIRDAFPSFVVETIGAGRSVAGGMTAQHVAQRYARAQRVVYPSHYEGFGLPLMEALAHGAAVIARDTEVNRELLGRLGRTDVWGSFRTGAELVQVIKSAKAIPLASTTWRWADAAASLATFIGDAVREYNPSRASRRASTGAARA